MPRAFVLLASVALAAGCSTVGTPPPSTAGAAPTKDTPQQYLAHVEAEPKTTAADYGHAALATWLITGDPGRTNPWVGKALALDANEPQALFTKMLMDRESLNDRGVAENALAILTHAPQSPFAELAAYRLRESVGESPALDRKIENGLAPLLTGSMGLEGHAALRAREVLMTLRTGHNDDAGAAAVRTAMGTPTVWAVVGPLHAYRLRDFNKPSSFDDPKHALSDFYSSVLGGVAPRVFHTPEGGLDLEPDTWRADIYEALTDVKVRTGGEYILSLRGAAEATVFIDGVVAAQRRPLPARPPERSWGLVELPAGPHRIRIRFARVDDSWLSLEMGRADGAPSDLAFAAPARHVAPPVATAHALPVRSWGAIAAVDQVLPSALSPVDRFLRIEQLMTDDSDRARAELDDLFPAAGASPTVRALRADLLASDDDLPRANAVAQLTQDLDAILAVEPGDARAILGRFQQERNDKKYDAASARMKRLVEVVGALQPHVLMERASFALERENEAEARRDADAAMRADPDRCEALSFRLDLARRDGEVKRSEELVPKLLSCPGGLSTYAVWLRSHLKSAEAIPYLRRLLARDPDSSAARRSLADALFSLGDTHGAEMLLAPLPLLWPYEADAFKRFATYRELEGQTGQAHDMLERARHVDGGDIGVDRALAVDAHEELVGWGARDGLEAIAAFKKSSFHPHAPAIQVLDLGALEVLPDGSSLERVQSIVQVLDKRGIDQYGEISIPNDAIPLVVRTVKADGRILDAEAVSGKETISAPNLEPGDFVEYGYVHASGPRQAALKGWSGGQFIFAGDETPFFESTYLVRAPAKLGLQLDSANLNPPARVERSGDMLTLTYTRRRADAYLREPLPVSDLEVLPWIEAGAGAGQDATIAELADFLPMRARVSNAVTAFVRGTEGLAPVEKIKAIVDHIRQAVRGDSSSMDFSASPGAILVRGRGNRMLVLKAALDAVGIPSHVVFARAFTQDQHELRFPHGQAYGMALLRIEPPGSAPIWMDFSLRLSPLGHLQPILSGEEAYIVPNTPEELVERITLPIVPPEQDRTDTTMELAVDADGMLTGTITQRAYGFDAAGLRRRLEQISDTELKKAQERALSRSFHGLTLTGFDVNDSGNPDDPVVVTSTIHVPGYTDRGDGTRGIVANFGPLYLGPRFVSRHERTTPLLLPVDDLSSLHATLKLPPGVHVQPPETVDLKGPFGSYRDAWAVKDDVLALDERLLLRHGRITPAQYPDFKVLATRVDAAQAREILFDGHASSP